MTTDRAKELFGVDPEAIVDRLRGFHIVEEVSDHEAWVAAGPGDLCVCTRDPGMEEYPEEYEPGEMPENFIGWTFDEGDGTYAYLYFERLK